MSKFWKIISVYVLLTVSIGAHAQQVHVDSLRYWTAPDHTRMVFDVTTPATHQVFLLANPARLVIDFSDTKLLKPLAQPPANHRLFSRVRSAERNKTDLRVVVDLKTAVTPKSFSLRPSKTYGHRLVVDLFSKGKKTSATYSKKAKAYKAVTKTVKNKARDVIIAIDAGHGGEDPGAHGPKGSPGMTKGTIQNRKLSGRMALFSGRSAQSVCRSARITILCMWWSERRPDSNPATFD